MTAAERRRRADLAKIHIGAKQLGDYSEESYRDMLEAVVGVRSSKDLDAAGRRKVLSHLVSCGVKFRRPRKKGRGVPAPEKARLIRKIDALLINARGGARPRSYGEQILRRMTSHPHRTPLEWATPDQLVRVVQALEIERRRHG